MDAIKGTLISSTNKTNRDNITEILLKVVLKTTIQTSVQLQAEITGKK
jgi:hypothetical protein